MINWQGVKDNTANLLGIVVGLLILKPFRVRFTKEQRNSFYFSTVSANMAADGFVTILPYKMLYKAGK